MGLKNEADIARKDADRPFLDQQSMPITIRRAAASSHSTVAVTSFFVAFSSLLILAHPDRLIPKVWSVIENTLLLLLFIICVINFIYLLILFIYFIMKS
jgi:hypothetical protein